MPLSEAQIRGLRMRSHLLGGGSATPLDVVRRLGAVQSQNRPASLAAIGVRSPGSTISDAEQLFEDGSIVRSWTMRGTLHIVPAEDLGWMLALTAARMRAAIARESRLRGITESDYENAAPLIAQYVNVHGPATRAEVLDALERAGVDVGNERGYRYLRDAALRGLVVWGPMRGRQPQLVPAPPGPSLERDEALARFIVTYLTGHGPATVRDFAWWSGLSLTDARRALEIAGPAVEALGPDDEPMLVAGGEASSPPRRAARVNVVPAWDEYVLGYGDRSRALPDAVAWRVSPTGNGVFLPTILSSGMVVGTWTSSVSRSGLTAVAEPFESLNATQQRGFRASVSRYARFLGVPVAE